MEYDKWCKKVIRAVNLDESSCESSSESEDEMELDLAVGQEEEHVDDVDDGFDREEENLEATGLASVAAFQIDPQT
eukprot:5627777-Pyramimonas_sp.AAC.1